MNIPAFGEKSLDRLIRAIRELACGRSNATGTFTLNTGSATTQVTAPNCGADSTIILSPRTANAATEFGAGTWYISAKAPGSFTVTHVNSGTTGRTFDYAIQG